MSRKVRVRLEIDPSCQETEIVIRTCQKSKEAEEIIRAVERCVGNEYPPVTTYKGDTLVLVTQNDIFRVYTESRKLIVCTGNDRYESRQPLKELEEQLDEGHFVRISRFEIINLRKVSGFDFSQHHITHLKCFLLRKHSNVTFTLNEWTHALALGTNRHIVSLSHQSCHMRQKLSI